MGSRDESSEIRTGVQVKVPHSLVDEPEPKIPIESRNLAGEKKNGDQGKLFHSLSLSHLEMEVMQFTSSAAKIGPLSGRPKYVMQSSAKYWTGSKVTPPSRELSKMAALGRGALNWIVTRKTWMEGGREGGRVIIHNSNLSISHSHLI